MNRQIKLKISDFTVCTLLRVDNISIFAEEFDNLKRAVEIRLFLCCKKVINVVKYNLMLKIGSCLNLSLKKETNYDLSIEK